jgi:hypothetical protein
MKRFTIVSATVFLIGPNWCDARLIEPWPYDRLMKEADLVVIAQPQTVADSGETTTKNLWKVKFVGVNTTFTINSILKGKHEGQKLTVLHYRVEVDIEDGPGLVAFRLGGRSITTKGAHCGWNACEYLLYLKKRKDGRYEPVSGIIDPRESVREIVFATILNGVSRDPKKK